MAEPPEHTDDLDQAEVVLGLQVVRQMFDDEVKRLERLTGRVRNSFILAAGFFAVGQTVAFGSFQSALLSEHERRQVVWLAVASAVLVAIAGALVIFTDVGLVASHLSTDDVLSAVRDSSHDRSAAVALLSLYATAVDDIRGAVGRRRRRAVAAQSFAVATVAAVLAEVIWSLYARLH